MFLGNALDSHIDSQITGKIWVADRRPTDVHKGRGKSCVLRVSTEDLFSGCERQDMYFMCLFGFARFILSRCVPQVVIYGIFAVQSFGIGKNL